MGAGVSQDSRTEREGSLCSPPPRNQFTVRMRKHVPSVEADIPALVREILGNLETVQGLGITSHNLEIVLFEALANAVVHGNKSLADLDVFLRVYCAPSWGAAIFIRDQGRGFDPNTVPDPTEDESKLRSHGRGVFLMKELMDHVAYRKGGTEVLLVRLKK